MLKIPLVSLFLTLPLLAQSPCHVENNGNAFNDRVSMGGPNFTNCIRFTASNSQVVFAVQVFTGERLGTSTVGLWSFDTSTQKPGKQLATGKFQMRMTNAWQGANLDKPVQLTKGLDYFVSWIPVNGSQASVHDVNSATHPAPDLLLVPHQRRPLERSVQGPSLEVPAVVPTPGSGGGGHRHGLQ